MQDAKMFLTTLFVLFLGGCATLFPAKDHSDFNTISRYASYSSAAYMEPSELQTWADENQIQLIHTNKMTTDEVQYLILRPKDADYDVVAIRGTASLEDALVDMKFKLSYMDSFGAKVHTGFGKAAEKVLADAKPFLSKERPIHTTGHSLGGAEAVTLAMLLKNAGYRVDTIYTFGQPKVTNWAGKEKYKDLPITRIVTRNDVVPLVPPVSLDLKDDESLYWHIGGETLVYEGDTYSALGFLEAAARQVIDFIPNTITQVQLEAHRMDTYMNYLAPKRIEAKRIEFKLKQ